SGNNGSGDNGSGNNGNGSGTGTPSDSNKTPNNGGKLPATGVENGHWGALAVICVMAGLGLMYSKRKKTIS
ncbi:MAG: LPXTG cell wall anchor domain-containing protein, partial [Clostridium sp.]|nr:LPXTG cell wall anchor domain-containing protein [Clostridium sp.]